MEYNLTNGVWELTMACNMRCKHCGSSCEDRHEDELTTEEALALCDELKELGMKVITLSGGEPTLRSDLSVIVKRLVDNGIMVNIITNGWFVDEAIVKQLKASGITGIAISIDGLKLTHDQIRVEGSFERGIAALRLIKAHDVLPAVITTVNSVNINELDGLNSLFREIGIDSWQLQLALPMGNLKHNTEFFLEPHHVNQLIDFAHSKMSSEMGIFLADNVGYYNSKILELHQKSIPDVGQWGGCGAGKSIIGILNNGDITGCTSIRDKQFIAGNIRERSLKDIWYSEESFAWNRQMKKSQLKGLCAKCQFNDCLGGCIDSRLCMNGNIHSHNEYCSYYIEMKRIEDKVAQINDPVKLLNNAYSLATKKQFQSAEIVLSKLMGITPDSIDAKALLGYVHYELGNYELCENTNRQLLMSDPENAYATKGLGLSLIKLGQTENGLGYMYRAINMKNANAEIFYDLYVTHLSLEQDAEAMKIKEDAKKCDDYSIWEERFNKAVSNEVVDVVQ